MMVGRFVGILRERAGAKTVKEKVAFACKSPRSALLPDSLEAATFVAAELWKIVHVQMGVARDVKVDEAVAVVIAPGRPGHEAAATDSGLFGDVLEFAIAQTVVQRAAAEAGHK